MIWIILRSGKVLQYNRGNLCTVESGVITVCVGGDNGGLVAKLPLDIVERAEFEKPCRILREPKSLRRKRVYR